MARDDNGSGWAQIVPTRKKNIHPLPACLPVGYPLKKILTNFFKTRTYPWIPTYPRIFKKMYIYIYITFFK